MFERTNILNTFPAYEVEGSGDGLDTGLLDAGKGSTASQYRINSSGCLVEAHVLV